MQKSENAEGSGVAADDKYDVKGDPMFDESESDEDVVSDDFSDVDSEDISSDADDDSEYGAADDATVDVDAPIEHVLAHYYPPPNGEFSQYPGSQPADASLTPQNFRATPAQALPTTVPKHSESATTDPGTAVSPTEDPANGLHPPPPLPSTHHSPPPSDPVQHVHP